MKFHLSVLLFLTNLSLAGEPAIDPVNIPPTEGFPKEPSKLDVFTNPAADSFFSIPNTRDKIPKPLYLRHVAPLVLTRLAKYRNRHGARFTKKQNELFGDTVQLVKKRDYGGFKDLGKRCMKLFTLEECTEIYSSYNSLFDTFYPMRADEEPCNCSRASDTCGQGQECIMLSAAHCQKNCE